MRLPLEGIVVLDFSTLLPGPLATLLLAEAGADVIKIERPGGDELRAWEPRCGTESVQFTMLNRGKHSIVLDLKDPADRAQLDPLLRRADVLVEQFRPGVMARLGLGYEDVGRINPRIVYCSITGYGQYGSKSGFAGHDLNYLAETGLLALSMGSPASPVIPPALIADIAGGSYPAVFNILLALRNRDETARGCHLDVSMTDNLFTLMFSALGTGSRTGRWPKNGQDQTTGGSARYRLYRAKGGGMLAVGALEDRFWNVFCDVIGLEPSLREDRTDPATTAAAVAMIIATETTHTWAGRLEGKDCCCSIVRELGEAIHDRHFVERGTTSGYVEREAADKDPVLPLPLDVALRRRSPASVT
jgi:alpha-methylacyl-CoA racemase